MISRYGKRRVVIDDVRPSVNRGRYAAKATVGHPVTISASIFADGHDEIYAEALLKHSTDKQWKTVQLELVNNDHWTATFVPDKLGRYQLQVQAWIDHFASWQKALKKKHGASQDITVEIQAGIMQVSQYMATIAGKEKNILQQWTTRMQAAATADEQAAIAAETEAAGIMCRHREKDSITTTAPTVHEIEVDVQRAQFSTWYELFPRSAASAEGMHGTFKDVKKLLPRISEMGFDVLYLPPIHPIGEEKRKGRNNAAVAAIGDPGSPWAIGNSTGGHKAIHPQLGTLRDLKELITSAKKHGIELAMDIAFQCAPDHPYVAQHPEWFKWRPDGTVQHAENPPKKYEDILPLNFESVAWESLWQELRSIFLYWIEQGVSIFRVDNPHTKALPFWEWAIREIKTQHPQVIFLAEAFTRPRIMEHLAKIGFSQSYTYFTWRHTKQDIEEYMTELTKTPLQYYFRPNFWPNTPDILTPELARSGEAGHIIRAILAATLSSSWGMYGPVYEFGLNEMAHGKDEYADSEKYEIKHWEWGRYTRTKEVVSYLNRIRRENAALQQTNAIEFLPTDNEQVIAYLKWAEGSKLIVVVNLDPFHTQSAMVNVSAEKMGKDMPGTFKVYDMLSGDRYEWQMGNNYISLSPWDMPAHILRPEP
ncbi:alpha-1,4-glucan--maltose-1-phosphate maltosyltransferase [Nemorincola caseinilytica]|uniref:Alpha-1,4-glucan:maltose-1-phosphate maltosyltransferase n=1 Tax=Nemorincola caseinilytica TaxID=2054315 RepID=A0ABP8NQE3_9BACT